jgi:hypothetical protein
MESREPKRRFPAPWPVEKTDHGYIVKDSNGVVLAWIYCRDDLHSIQWADYKTHLTCDEARRIAKAIARIPEFLKKEPAFPESGNPHWSRTHPYHVALDGRYVAENYDEIIACCAYNNVPCQRTGEVVERGGTRWFVYKFARQVDALRFWDKFDGRWMYRESFIFPERPSDLPAMKSLPQPPGYRADKDKGRR